MDERKLHHSAVVKRLGFLMESLGLGEPEVLRRETPLSSGFSPLDPGRGCAALHGYTGAGEGGQVAGFPYETGCLFDFSTDFLGKRGGFNDSSLSLYFSKLNRRLNSVLDECNPGLIVLRCFFLLITKCYIHFFFNPQPCMVQSIFLEILIAMPGFDEEGRLLDGKVRLQDLVEQNVYLLLYIIPQLCLHGSLIKPLVIWVRSTFEEAAVLEEMGKSVNG